ALLLSFEALASTSVTAILFDTSRSVPPEDFHKATGIVQQYLGASGPQDRVILYAFGNDLRKVSPEQMKALEATESYTMLFDAAYEAAQDLNHEKADRKSVVIISDGVDTKSATILEDTAAFVNQRGIAVYGIGVGKAQRKTLERLALLTGGKYFSINDAGLSNALREAQAAQKIVEPVQPAPLVSPAPAQPSATAAPQAQPARAQPEQAPAPRQEQPPAFHFLWPVGVGAGLILLLAVGYVIARAFKKEERTCPNCGRALESYQTVCPSCPGTGSVRAASPDSTQEYHGKEEDAGLVPAELLEKRPMTEEMLSKTFVLMASPVLVIRKGKSVGQTFSLNRVYPVSIGRSRVNEIRLDDATISGQHCRIIPEQGHHVVCDLGSTNGTFVNEKRVNKQILNEGDIIKVGETQFLYKVEQQRN
ncbi:MAG TPA: FHA domain-containing protein, partial [Acidobacteriota bacterium]|nr:FHA domain-containing protein [Acidobacteriota bacterium]